MLYTTNPKLTLYAIAKKLSIFSESEKIIMSPFIMIVQNSFGNSNYY